MTDIISRDDARAFGLRRFYTGEPCMWGHICEHYTSSGECVECKRNPTSQCSARELRKRHDYLRSVTTQRPPLVTVVTLSKERSEGNGDKGGVHLRRPHRL